jgi:hypothetical protein
MQSVVPSLHAACVKALLKLSRAWMKTSVGIPATALVKTRDNVEVSAAAKDSVALMAADWIVTLWRESTGAPL